MWIVNEWMNELINEWINEWRNKWKRLLPLSSSLNFEQHLLAPPLMEWINNSPINWRFALKMIE